MGLEEKAREYATKCHSDTNHMYGDKPYSYHLQMVRDAAKRFIGIIPEEDRDRVLAGCWVHDVIEDARETYNDVRNVLGMEVAELAYALTNEKGRNRSERANEKYYQGIRDTKYASFIKLCDRIANFENSIKEGSRMASMYAKENKNFCEKLYFPEYLPLIDHLRRLSDSHSN